MLKKYILVARNKICTSKPQTDETLKTLDCYYESPMFYAEVTREDLNNSIDKYRQNFKDFKNWNAELVELK